MKIEVENMKMVRPDERQLFLSIDYKWDMKYKRPLKRFTKIYKST